jgi:hypothetical protein
VPNIRVQKDVNELLELQDRAIQAQQQATLALQIALQALQDSRVEKGDQQKMVFVPVQEKAPYNSPENSPFTPYSTPFYSTPFVNPTQWPGSTVICKTIAGSAVGVAGMGGVQCYNGSAQDVVEYALSTVQTASNFACAGSSK